MANSFLGIELNPFSRLNKAVINILLLCIYVFLALFIVAFLPFGEIILMKLAFTPAFPAFLYQPWSIFTYIFMHDGFWHLFGNMLWLFFVGVILEDLTGKRYIWKLFIGGGIFGAIFFGLIYNLFMTKGGYPLMVGASAGVSAIIIGTAVFAPRYKLYLFGIIPIDLMWIALFRVFFDIFGSAGHFNQGGFLSHIGGEIFGLLFVMHTRGNIHIPLVDAVADFMANLFKSKPKSKSKPLRKASVSINKNLYNPKTPPRQEEIDRVLDKINQSGYESLTKEEKELLFRAGD